jgi:hypothetical protein
MLTKYSHKLMLQTCGLGIIIRQMGQYILLKLSDRRQIYAV